MGIRVWVPMTDTRMIVWLKILEAFRKTLHLLKFVREQPVWAQNEVFSKFFTYFLSYEELFLIYAHE